MWHDLMFLCAVLRSDQVREIVAQSGYLEVMTWILSNYDENFSKLKREDDGSVSTLNSHPPI